MNALADNGTGWGVGLCQEIANRWGYVLVAVDVR